MAKKFILPLLLLILITTGCGNTKYTYHFEKGRLIDFSEGEWLLNHPFTNYYSERIDDLAAKHFQKILGDSLTRLTEMPYANVVAASLPFEPSKEQLKAAKKITGHDYLINVQSNTVKDEMGSFAHAPAMGSTINTNRARTAIRIYDLNSGELVSESSVTGTAKVTKNEGDKNWDYVNNAATISMQSLRKLIKKYRKNRVKD